MPLLLNKLQWIPAEAEFGPCTPDTEINLGDRVLGEVEKNSFIVLPGKGGIW